MSTGSLVALCIKKRRRIDRSMIGEPMNFIHLTHLGSGDMSNDGPMVRTQERQKGRSAHQGSSLVSTVLTS
ncbi:UNVERIFIED_CONTAM: hypothetical protein FKN15_024803 [Acipenser sinensis]